MRTKLKDYLIKQLKSTSSGTIYPDDMTDDEFKTMLLASIDKNINTIKNIIIGLLLTTVVSIIIINITMAR